MGSSIHIGESHGSKELWVLLVQLGRCHALRGDFWERWSVHLEDPFLFPYRLVFLLQSNERISFLCLWYWSIPIVNHWRKRGIAGVSSTHILEFQGVFGAVKRDSGSRRDRGGHAGEDIEIPSNSASQSWTSYLYRNLHDEYTWGFSYQDDDSENLRVTWSFSRSVSAFISSIDPKILEVLSMLKLE